MRTCLVSVVVPIYNVAAYLRECLDSVLGQSLQDIEVLCVDDGSTDSSPEILREYAARDARVRIITQENGGLGCARNTGMEAATGRYLAFLDSDDVMRPGALEQSFRTAEAENADVVVFGFRLFDTETKETLGIRAFSGDLVGGTKGYRTWTPKALGGLIFSDVGHAMWDKLFRRSFVEANALRCQELRRTEDLYFADKALLCARRITVLSDILYDYRKGVPSLTRRDDLAGLCFVGYRSIRDFLVDRGDFALFAPKFLEHVVYSFAEELLSVSDDVVLEAVYPRFKTGLLSVMPREDLVTFVANPYWTDVYDLAFSTYPSVEIRRTLSRMERTRSLYERALASRGAEIVTLKSSWSYRIGRLLTRPVRMARRLLRKNG